jgi:hypothetical protein
MVVALEGVAHALNPKHKRERRKNSVWFGLFYLLFLLAGVVFVILLAFRP